MSFVKLLDKSQYVRVGVRFANYDEFKRRDGEHESYLVKVYSQEDGKDYTVGIIQESAILMNLTHKAVIKYYGTFLASEVGGKSGIVMDFMDMSLEQAIGQAWFNDTMKSIVVAGIAFAMKEIHKMNITHRKLEPRSILLNKNHHPFIANFESCEIDMDTMQDVVGTTR